MPDGVLLVVYALAAYRVTRLVVKDTLFDIPRSWLTVRLPAIFADLISCAWCIGFWISAAATYGLWLDNATLNWIALAFAASTVVGLISQRDVS